MYGFPFAGDSVQVHDPLKKARGSRARSGADAAVTPTGMASNEKTAVKTVRGSRKVEILSETRAR
ncbi:MAG: hypothetical protein NVS3B28_25000 [Candidatus Velthaea sp.]